MRYKLNEIDLTSIGFSNHGFANYKVYYNKDLNITFSYGNYAYDSFNVQSKSYIEINEIEFGENLSYSTKIYIPNITYLDELQHLYKLITKKDWIIDDTKINYLSIQFYL